MKAIMNNLYILHLIWNKCPLRVLVQIFERCFSFSYGAFYTLLFFRYIINSIQRGIPFSSVILFLLFFTAIGLADGALKAWFYNIYRPKTDQVILEGLTALIYKQSLQADIACFETPDYYNRYTRAVEQMNTKALQILDTTSHTIAIIFALFLNAGFALLVEPGILLISIIPLILTFYFEQKRSKCTYKLETENIRHRRRADYVKRTVYLREYAKEMRLTNIMSVMSDSFDTAVKNMLTAVKKHGFYIALYRFIAEFAMQILLYISLYAYIAYRYLVENAFLLGDFASLSGAVINLVHFIEDLAENYSVLYQSGLYAENLKTFLSEKPSIVSGNRECSFQKDIEFRHVNFTYAGQKEPALKDISFTLQKGKKIAFVGRNGAGKTTLVKLLMRLYDPSDGEIRIDGEDIRTYEIESLRSCFVTAFQNFRLYAATVSENVLMRRSSPEDENKVKRALQNSGLSIKSPADVVLTREFDDNGLVLSGGQAQKIAVARVFASDAPIVVLDEPSAALDPISEAEMFDNLTKACKDKTMIFISHRLSSVQSADKIYLLENGEIVEQGSHRQLMEQDGKYADMFRKQAEKYQDQGQEGADNNEAC